MTCKCRIFPCRSSITLHYDCICLVMVFSNFMERKGLIKSKSHGRIILTMQKMVFLTQFNAMLRDFTKLKKKKIKVSYFTMSIDKYHSGTKCPILVMFLRFLKNTHEKVSCSKMSHYFSKTASLPWASVNNTSFEQILTCKFLITENGNVPNFVESYL